MSSKELNLEKKNKYSKHKQKSKTKKIKKSRKGRKKSTISNFLLTTFDMIDVSIIRIPKAKIRSSGMMMEPQLLSRISKILQKYYHRSLRQKTIHHL